MNRYSEWFLVGPRGSGRTHALAEACRFIDATMICANHQHAASVRSLHDIPTISIESSPDRLKGLRGPFLADHFTMLHITTKYEVEIQNLSQEVLRQKGLVLKQTRLNERVIRERDDYKNRYHETLQQLDDLRKLAYRGD